jgi:glycerophosphoryl diester phosphodiesterase
MKRLTTSPVPEWLVQIPIAHRGLHSMSHGSPENSLAAFEHAIQKRFPIELDVHLLSDNKIAVYHDDNLKRMTGHEGIIERSDSALLKTMRLLHTEHKIPLLEDVLDLVRGRVPLLIDIKNKQRQGKLESALCGYLSNYRGDFAVQSFNPFALQWFFLHAPGIPRGQLSGDFRGEKLVIYKKFLLKNLFLNGYSKPHFISYDVRCIPSRVVSRQKKKGLPVIGWTVQNREELERVRMWCVNIIFEGFEPPQ